MKKVKEQVQDFSRIIEIACGFVVGWFYLIILSSPESVWQGFVDALY